MKKSIRNILAGTASVVAAATIITGGTVFGSAIKAEKSSIGAEAAVSAAFKDAGLKKEDVLRTESDFDRKNGKYVFDVEFDANGKEYDYVIDAKSGAVIERKAEKDNDTKKPEKTSAAEIRSESEAKAEKASQPAKSEKIDLDAAKEKAVKDAGFEINSVKFIKAKLDKDDGKAVYEIEFTADGKEYEYDINAETGAITDKDIENVKKTPAASKAETTKASADKNADIEKAKQTALADAGVKAADAKFIKAEADVDDGRKVFDIEFIAGSKEYEYEINASTGKVIDKDVGNVKKAPAASKAAKSESAKTSSNQSADIEKAKQIALSYAGVNAADAKFIKAEADVDDGRKVFDIEFIAGSKEYEYEINASTGKVIDKDIEAVKTKPQAVKEAKTSSAEQKSDFIGVDSAKQKALSHAGLNGSDVRFTKVKLDKDDGISVYEIEFISGKYEYEYEINAKTGKIIDWDKEID